MAKKKKEETVVKNAPETVASKYDTEVKAKFGQQSENQKYQGGKESTDMTVGK